MNLSRCTGLVVLCALIGVLLAPRAARASLSDLRKSNSEDLDTLEGISACALELTCDEGEPPTTASALKQAALQGQQALRRGLDPATFGTQPPNVPDVCVGDLNPGVDHSDRTRKPADLTSAVYFVSKCPPGGGGGGGGTPSPAKVVFDMDAIACGGLPTEPHVKQRFVDAWLEEFHHSIQDQPIRNRYRGKCGNPLGTGPAHMEYASGTTTKQKAALRLLWQANIVETQFIESEHANVELCNAGTTAVTPSLSPETEQAWLCFRVEHKKNNLCKYIRNFNGTYDIFKSLYDSFPEDCRDDDISVMARPAGSDPGASFETFTVNADELKEHLDELKKKVDDMDAKKNQKAQEAKGG